MAGSERIAVLGAGGTMGFAIARNLAKAGFDVRAWNAGCSGPSSAIRPSGFR
jgi:3-hydroxyisobutyrate dehydrogenase-like beta-hydroxyacid dehydrogenase